MQKLLEVAQFKAIRGNLILVIIASYTLILELVNRSRKFVVVGENMMQDKRVKRQSLLKMTFFDD